MVENDFLPEDKIRNKNTAAKRSMTAMTAYRQ